MGQLLRLFLAGWLLVCPAMAMGGEIWTDVNGDGLPDNEVIGAPPGDSISIDLWIDSGNFLWTGYIAYAIWDSCFTYVENSGEYPTACAETFPIDRITHERIVGFYSRGCAPSAGLFQAGSFKLQVTTPGPCCVTPMVDMYTPYYVFSMLLRGNSYDIFGSSIGTCTAAPPNATAASTWGALKALYR